MSDQYDLTSYVGQLLEAHDAQIEEDGDKIRVTNWPQPVSFAGTAFVSERDDSVISRFDVVATLPDGRELCEAFGDSGGDVEDTLNKNLHSFATSSLHVMVAAFSGEPGEIDVEEWPTASGPARVYLGPAVWKSNAADCGHLDVPAGFWDLGGQVVADKQLSPGFHFLRMYYSRNGDDVFAAEFQLDNEDLPGPEEALRALDWQAHDFFYSARHFAILHVGG